jgi:predicted nucleotidyltransferase
VSAATIDMLESAAAVLGPLVDREVVFVGGATIALWNTDPAAFDFRPTDDVDVIVEVASRSEYYQFEDRLRELGFVNDQGGVICRFRHPAEDLILDVMPTEATILGFENHWQKESVPHAVSVELPSGRAIQAVPPPFLLATKLEAFRSRGEGDLFLSHDFEDLITLLDRREELVEEVYSAPRELREFAAAEFTDLLRHRDFDPAGE